MFGAENKPVRNQNYRTERNATFIKSRKNQSVILAVLRRDVQRAVGLISAA